MYLYNLNPDHVSFLTLAFEILSGGRCPPLTFLLEAARKLTPSLHHRMSKPWFKNASSWAVKAGLEKLKPTSTRSLQIDQHPIEGNGWADIPAEVIEKVLDNLSAQDRWNSRLISSNWGTVVRDCECSVVLPVDQTTLWSRATSFRQRQKQYPRTRFTLKLAKAFGFAGFAELLSSTVIKGDKLSNCDLEVTLAITQKLQPSHVVQVCRDVRVIAAAAKALQKQDVVVRLRLQSVLPYELTLMLAMELGPFLLSIDYHQVIDLSAELLQVSNFVTKPAATFSLAGLRHLGNSDSPIQSLCLSDHSLLNVNPCQPLASSIGVIASLQHLTRLHLSNQARTDFHPLTQLTSLEDLALQSGSRSASASDVLHSNSHSLQRLVLSSRGWDTATFEALHDLPKLGSLTIKVLFLTDGDAATLSSLQTPVLLQLMLRRCGKMQPQTVHTLTTGTASITHLELWEVDQACFSELELVKSLLGLTLVRPCLDVTGQGFKLQPKLEILRLVSCFGMSNEGLRELIAATPALKMLMIQQELQHSCPELRDTDPLTKHGLISLVEAHKLMYVDLQGVKVTKGGEKLLESSICAQQKAGKMPPAVALVLPKFSNRYGESMSAPDCLQYPAFVSCSEGRSKTIHCGSVIRDAGLQEILAALQALQVPHR